MNAARKKAAEAMEKVDMVIEVLDARLPQASCNPMIEQLRIFRQRPCLKILNKSDLADPVVTQSWIDFYNKQKDVRAVALSCKKPSDVAKIPIVAACDLRFNPAILRQHHIAQNLAGARVQNDLTRGPTARRDNPHPPQQGGFHIDLAVALAAQLRHHRALKAVRNGCAGRKDSAKHATSTVPQENSAP